jgi:hypothetical protein
MKMSFGEAACSGPAGERKGAEEELEDETLHAEVTEVRQDHREEKGRRARREEGCGRIIWVIGFPIVTVLISLLLLYLRGLF